MSRIEHETTDQETIDLANSIFSSLQETQRSQVLDAIEKVTGTRAEELADMVELETLKHLLSKDCHEELARMQKEDPELFREKYTMITLSNAAVENRDK
jgi:hypothetical protein